MFLPAPWREFHLLGGAANTQHLKWSAERKQFVGAADTANISGKGKGIVAQALLFSGKFQQFVLLGGGGGDAIWSLSYPPSSNTQTKGLSLRWIKSLCRLPYAGLARFGCVMFNEQYILLLGGVCGDSTALDEIFIFDIERNEWRQSRFRCPRAGALHAAVYVAKQRRVHLMAVDKDKDKDGDFAHWTLDLDAILMHTHPYTRQEEQQERVAPVAKAYADFDEQEAEGNNAELEADHMHKHALYKDAETRRAQAQAQGKTKTKIAKGAVSSSALQVQQMAKEMGGLRDEISLMWDFMTQLKNDMQVMKEYQIEMIKNCQQNSLRIIETHRNLTENYARKKDKDRQKRKKKRDRKNMLVY